MVKYIFKLMLCMALLGTVTACSNDDYLPENTVNVTPGVLDGTWTLTEWNGKSLEEGLYVYLTFERKERTFVMYDNMDSMYSNKRTGTFTILKDEEYGTILTGEYDYDQGEWSEYIVTSIDEHRMTLVLKSDLSDVSVYTRCAGVPEDIQNGSRKLVD